MLSGHQDIGSDLSFEIDGLYSWRRDRRGYAATAAATGPFYEVGGPSWMAAVAPSLTWRPASGWSASIAGTYGVDRLRFGTIMSTPTSSTRTLSACACNRAWSIEAGAQGPLFALPGGNAKLAIGGGLRSNDFHYYRTIGPALDIDATQDIFFGYGEVSLPFISPDLDIAGINRLTASAAVRYESYKGLESLATPKFGLNYSPVEGLELKGSWGKAFKGATLFQRFNTQIAVVRLASTRGGAGYPTGSTVLDLAGGNPDLKAERAETWTASVVATPRSVPGLRLEATYYAIRYRNRIASPIAVAAQSLSNPNYASVVTLAPTSADLAAALDGRVLQFNSVGSYDPSRVVAIIDNRVSNVAAQRVKGIDLSAAYTIDIDALGSLSANAGATYLKSKQQVVAGADYNELTGTYLNPPHWRLRGGLSWSKSGFSAAANLNYSSGLDDVRFSPAPDIDGVTTVDLTLRYETPQDKGIWSGIEASFSAQNLFNVAPPYSRSTFVAETPYDSTNFSPVGRFLSVGIAKKW